ncbi:MAG: hypothetical protein ACFB11_00840 [Paracoccaceae bacterium]
MTKPVLPAAGGSYVRQDDGSLKKASPTPKPQKGGKKAAAKEA